MQVLPLVLIYRSSSFLLFSILGASVGGCAVYLNFTGNVLAQVYCPIPAYLYALIMGSIVFLFIVLQALLLVYFRWDPLLFLARSSIVGFLFATGAAIATCILGGLDLGGIGQNGPYVWFDGANLPDSFGSIAFLFCVALFCFPLHSAIDKPRNFTKAIGIGYGEYLCLVIVSFILLFRYGIAWFFNAAFGLISYAIFGVAIAQIAVNSLDATAVSTKVVQIVLSLDVFFTFLIVVVPSANSVRKLLHKISHVFYLDENDLPRFLLFSLYGSFCLKYYSC